MCIDLDATLSAPSGRPGPDGLPTAPRRSHGRATDFRLAVYRGLGALLVGLAGCAPRGPAPLPEDVERVLDEVETAIVDRAYDSAHSHVDYRFRLDEVLGDLWRSGSDADREDLERLTRGMFEDTSERHRERMIGKRMVRDLLKRGAREVWVESRPEGDGDLVWRYRLTRREDTWAITQREVRVSGVPSDSTRFWPMAQKQLAIRFGRPVTLRELTANLPSVMGTLRARAIRIPALHPPGEAP